MSVAHKIIFKGDVNDITELRARQLSLDMDLENSEEAIAQRVMRSTIKMTMRNAPYLLPIMMKNH